MNNDSSFLRPLWRRVLLVAACAAWSAIEFTYGDDTWGWIVGVFAAYGAYSYLIAYKPAPEKPAEAAPKED